MLDRSYHDLWEKLVDIMYENEKRKEENSKPKKTFEKAYDFIKQFGIDGKDMLEIFLENIGQGAK